MTVSAAVSNTLSSAALKSVNGVPATASTAASEAGSQDRFLKLLVTQLKNQDPLSPMDNAQLTSQIAQINTVSGLATVNTSVQQLSSQFLQMQTLQGASLVGKDVVVAGNKLDISSDASAKPQGQGGFDLASSADAVRVDVLSPAGHVLDSFNMGAQGVGSHSFSWPAGSYDNASQLTFRVSASSAGVALESTALMRDRVTAVSTSGDKLMLELRSAGRVPYSTVKAFN